MVTSSGITIDGKVYRNLESQVAYNAEMIEQLLAGGGGGGSGTPSAAVNVIVPPSMWTESSIGPFYQECIIPYPSGITAANAIWCNPDDTYYKIKVTYPVIFVGFTTEGLFFRIMSTTPPVDTYIFNVIFIPTLGTPIAIDATNYVPEVTEGLTYFETIRFSVSSWREVTTGVRSTVWNDSAFADIYLNYSDGYNIYLCPANAAAQEFINKYRIEISDPLLTESCTFIAWNATSTPSSPTINFNVFVIPNTTSTSYIFLQ